MAGAHSKRNRQSRNAKLRRRRRVVGLSSGAGAMLAFGLGPLAHAPAANADDFGAIDTIIDNVINSLSGVDPALGTGLDGWVANLDTALSGASAADPATATAATTDYAALWNTDVYAPDEAAEQAWITSSYGEAFDADLNAFWQDFGGQGILIGNGADGTAADPTGGAGGLWFGDGGSGWNSGVAGEAGGNGGIAYDGDGGDGGAGYEGSMGGAGGDTAYGIGGEGGQGGAADGGLAGS